MGLEDPRYARDISFPFRYDENCDLALDENEQVIDQSVYILVFSRRGGIVLYREFGSEVELSVFDQLDDVLELELDTSIREAISRFEGRVLLDKELTFDELADSSKIQVVLPITIKNTGQQYYARLNLPRPGMHSVTV